MHCKYSKSFASLEMVFLMKLANFHVVGLKYEEYTEKCVGVNDQASIDINCRVFVG